MSKEEEPLNMSLLKNLTSYIDDYLLLAEILSRGEELPPIDDETECSEDED